MTHGQQYRAIIAADKDACEHQQGMRDESDHLTSNGFAKVMQKETFAAFTISQIDGAMFRLGDACQLGKFDSLQEAIDRAAPSADHKGIFAVKVTDNLTGAVLVKFYTVKRKSQPTAVYCRETHRSRNVYPLYAEHLFDMKLGVLG